MSASTGKKLWNFTTIGGVMDPAVAVGVGYLCSGGQTTSVSALNAKDGNRLWSYKVGNYSSYNGISGPVVVNGVVYVASSGTTAAFDEVDNVYALNATNGDELWNYTSNWPGFMNWSSPAVAGGVVYISCGILYALNATDGIQLWQYQAETKYGLDDFTSSPAVVNSVVYIGSNLGTVYAIGGTPIPNSPSTLPSPTSSTSSSSPTPLPGQEPFPTVIVSAISGVAVAVGVGTGVFVYFKKHKCRAKN